MAHSGLVIPVNTGREGRPASRYTRPQRQERSRQAGAEHVAPGFGAKTDGSGGGDNCYSIAAAIGVIVRELVRRTSCCESILCIVDEHSYRVARLFM